MRLSVIFSIAIGLFAFQVQGQISESNNVMTKGSQPSFSFTVDQIDERAVQRVYRSHLRSEYRTRPSRDRRSNEWVAEDITVVGIDASTPLNIYARFNEAGGAVAINLWFEMEGDFISTGKYPSKKLGIEEFIDKLKSALRAEAIENILSEQERELSALERQLNRLQRDKRGYESDISNAEKLIKESREKIENNRRDQSEMEEMIQRQKDIIQRTQARLRDID